MNRKWYVLRSKPNKAVILWGELTAHGFDCFYPQLHVRPVNPRSRTVRPYFPGYLFLHADMEETVTSMIQWMPFSSGFVSFAGLPATVPDNLIQAICQHVQVLLNLLQMRQVHLELPENHIRRKKLADLYETSLGNKHTFGNFWISLYILRCSQMTLDLKMYDKLDDGNPIEKVY